jgi:hypothetical protein
MLKDPKRKIVRAGLVTLRRANMNEMELYMYLFDHCIVFTKVKKNDRRKIYKDVSSNEIEAHFDRFYICHFY